MKGVIFNLLEEAVREEHGEDTWDDLLESAGLEGAYTSLGNYPHEDLVKLVGAASEALSIPGDDIVRWFGRRALAMLAERYPKFFEPHRTTRGLLLSLNDIIHPEVRKVYPGAEAPEFDYDLSHDDALVMSYRSSRQLCAFAEGLIEGAAEHYGEKVAIEQSECSKRGGSRCVFRISLAPRGTPS
jgi:hypothetical protein